MSTVEEDVELRDLVAQTLEKNGCLSKLRAELRASIFLALDEDIKLNKQQPFQNRRIQSYLGTPEGRALFTLVREFLDFFNLQFTISVYEPESYFDSIGQYEGRQKVAKDLGLDNTGEPTVPLLQQLLKIAQTNSKILDINLNINNTVNGSYIEESLNADSSYKKTETYNSLSNDGSTKIHTNQNDEIAPILNENNHCLNKTFDLNSPTAILTHLSKKNNEIANISKNLSQNVIQEENIWEEKCSINTKYLEDNFNKNIVNNPCSSSQKSLTLFGEKSVSVTQSLDVDESSVELNKNLTKKDDTYEDTSSIAEDVEAIENSHSMELTQKSEIEVTSNNSIKTNDNSVHLSTKSELEKPKLSPQRPKTSLSSLTDLPPLLINKTRVNNDILPSLYSKEFKAKSNLKELDKMFDMDAEYEEDFLYSNSLPLNQSKANLDDLDKLNIINKNENKSSSKGVPDSGKPTFRPSVPKTCSNLLKTGEQSSNRSINEHSLSD